MLKLFRNRYFTMFLRLAVAAFFLWWVLRDLKFSELTKLTWQGILLGVGSAVVLILTQVVLTAVRWRMLLRGQGITISFYRAVSLTFQGCMFSLFMPGGAVGGDVLKAAFLTRETPAGHKVEGVTTIFLDRVIGMMGLFLLVLIAAACCLPQILQFEPKIRLLTLIMMAVCLAGILAGLVLLFQDVFFRIRIFALLLEKADRLAHGALTRILASVEVCRRDRKTLLWAFLLSFLLLHPMLISGAFLIIWSITGCPPPFGGSALAFLLGNTASVAPVTPGGLGTRDKVIEVVLTAVGVDPGAASLTPILYSIAMLSSGLAGIVFFLLDMRSTRRENEK